MPGSTATGAFGPAPPGVDLTRNQNGRLLGAVIPVSVFGTIAVILRLAVRLRRKEMKLAIDDYLIVAALLFSWGTAISCFISIPFGNGYHLQTLSKEDFIIVWKILFAYVMIYATAVTCTKASIITFYGRIFQFRWTFWVCLFLVIGYWITIIVTISVACRPLPYFWLAYTNPTTAKGACIDVPTFFFANGIAAMLIDMFILCIPIPIIYGLQMQLSQKIAVSGILLLGSFVCVASICRIISLQTNTHGTDATWTMAPVFIWSSVEPFVGIICACLPSFGPYFRHWWSAMRTSRSSGPSGNPSSANRPRGTTTWRRKYPAKVQAQDSLFSVNKFGCVDEVQLMNEINAQKSGRGEAGSEDQDMEYGDSMGAITVKQDVDVSWSKSPKHSPY